MRRLAFLENDEEEEEAVTRTKEEGATDSRPSSKRHKTSSTSSRNKTGNNAATTTTTNEPRNTTTSDTATANNKTNPTKATSKNTSKNKGLGVKTAAAPQKLEYPSYVPLPHRDTVRAVFEEVLRQQQEQQQQEQQASSSSTETSTATTDPEPIEKQVDDGEKRTEGAPDVDPPITAPTATTTTTAPLVLPPEQLSLVPAGLLALSDVLLPCVAHEHGAILKRLEGLVRRDCKAIDANHGGPSSTSNPSSPPMVCAILNVRKALLDGIRAAIAAARKSRERRLTRVWDETRRVRAHQATIQAAEQVLYESQRPQRLRDARKRYGRNRDVYREQAHLLHELAQLERDEKMWNDAHTALILEQQQRQVEESAGTAADHPSRSTEGDADDDDKEVSKTALMDGVVTAAHDELHSLQVSAARLEAAVQVVEKLLARSEQLRRQTFQAYTREQQFAGYPGVTNPKGLLKALSQPSQSQQSAGDNEDDDSHDDDDDDDDEPDTFNDDEDRNGAVEVALVAHQ